MKSCITMTVLAIAMLAFPLGAASAEDVKMAKKVEDLNRAAMEDYDLLEFESAKKQLTDALALVKKAHLEKNAVAARTHLNLGIVYAGGLNDNDTAVLEFMSAVEIDASLKLDAAYRTPALQKLFDQARTQIAGKGKAVETKPAETPPVAPVETTPNQEPITVAPLGDAPGGQPIAVSVKVAPAVKAKQVVLYFRPAGSPTFLQLPMKSTGGQDYQAQIPEQATSGDGVQYYVEARGANGKAVASAGNSAAPSLVAVVHQKKQPAVEAKPAKPAQADEDENPLAGGNAKPAQRKPEAPEVPPSGGGGTTGDTAVTGEGVVTPKPKKLYLAVNVGTGGGYVNGETEVSHEQVTCCVALAPFHLMPEIGYYLRPNLTLSLYGRIGLPLGANVLNAATAAPAVFARAAYYLRKPGAGLYVHGDLGGGVIRHVIKLKSTSAAALQGDTDTYATGPLFLGGGAGYAYAMSSSVRLIADLNVEMGIPVVSSLGDSKPGFAVNLDLNIGAALAF